MIGIVLTYNEERHIARCLESLIKICTHVYVIDSYSEDNTLQICKKFQKVTILQNVFITHSNQLQWGLSEIQSEDKWIIRLDADEHLDDALSAELDDFSPDDVKGYKLNRTIFFDGKPVNKGGQFPIQILRLFHKDYAKVDGRPMDEKILVEGKVSNIKAGAIIDDNQNKIDWWIHKHLHYAKLEAMTQFRTGSIKPNSKTQQRIYYLFPDRFASICLFIYRFIFKSGFLGSKENIYFLVFQTLWYRTLVSYYVNRLKKLQKLEAKQEKVKIVEMEFGQKYGLIFEEIEFE